MLRGMLEWMMKDTMQLSAQHNTLACAQEHCMHRQGNFIMATLRPVLSQGDILGKGIIILTNTIIGVPFPAICISPAQGKAASHTMESRCRAIIPL